MRDCAQRPIGRLRMPAIRLPNISEGAVKHDPTQPVTTTTSILDFADPQAEYERVLSVMDDAVDWMKRQCGYPCDDNDGCECKMIKARANYGR